VPVQPSDQWLPGGEGGLFLPGLKRLECESDCTPTSGAEVKEYVDLYLRFPYSVTALCLTSEHRDVFSFNNAVSRRVITRNRFSGLWWRLGSVQQVSASVSRFRNLSLVPEGVRFHPVSSGYGGYFPGIKRPGREVNRSFSCCAEVKNEGCCAFGTPVCHHDVDDIFTRVVLEEDKEMMAVALTYTERRPLL
jgi:hypothetical protein